MRSKAPGLDLREVLLFLSRISPDSNVRLMLQLALASEVPEDTLQVLEQRIAEGASLVDMLQQDNLLIMLLEADDKIDVPEENMLYETIEQIGIAVPADRGGAEYLLQDLTTRLIGELSSTSSPTA